MHAPQYTSATCHSNHEGILEWLGRYAFTRGHFPEGPHTCPRILPFGSDHITIRALTLARSRELALLWVHTLTSWAARLHPERLRSGGWWEGSLSSERIRSRVESSGFSPSAYARGVNPWSERIRSAPTTQKKELKLLAMLYISVEYVIKQFNLLNICCI